MPRPAPSRHPRHIVIDTTGLKVFGTGEWYVRKHGIEEPRRRTWKKLHLCVDETSKEIAAVDLTTASVHDSAHLPSVLDLVTGEIGQVSADTAYDSATCYEAVLTRGAVPTIPPRRNARFSNAKVRLRPGPSAMLLFAVSGTRVDMRGASQAGRPGRALPRTPCPDSNLWSAIRLRRERSSASRSRCW